MAAPLITSPTQNATILINNPLTGKGPANTKIILYEEGVGTKLGDAIADDLGNWIISMTGLRVGPLKLIVGTDPLTAGGWSNIVTVTVVNTPPPNAGKPLEIQSPKKGDTFYPRPSIVGTGPANTKITLHEAGIGAELASTISDALGNWMITLTKDLHSGAFSLLASSSPALGQWSNTVPITIAPMPLMVQTLHIDTPTEGTLSHAYPTVSGTGPANSTITLYESGESYVWATTVCSPYGNWTLIPSTPLMPSSKNGNTFKLIVTANAPSGPWSNIVNITIS